MFPQLESVKLDWEALASQMSARRTELMEETSEGMESADDTDPDDEDSDEPTTAPMDPSRGQANTVGGKAAKHTTQSRARA